MKILLVEDDLSQIEVFKNTLKRKNVELEESENNISFESVLSFEDAERIIDSSFDGAIVDLRLAGDDQNTYSGNDVIENIRGSYRIPLCIVTSTPMQKDSNIPAYVKVFKREGNYYLDALNELLLIFDTGIPKIMNGRGLLEKHIDDIFWNYLLPKLDVWKSLAEKDSNPEKAILRFTLTHLMEYLNTYQDTFLIDEIYISPPINQNAFYTGAVVEKKESRQKFIILSPACDLVPRSDGQPKTSEILVCEIEPLDNAVKLCNAKKLDKRKKFFGDLLRNNYTNYYHFLPQSTSFDGGLINFRKVSTHPTNDFGTKFLKSNHQINQAFVKDIVSRFSAYYARQGQPSFQADEWINSASSLDRIN